VIIGSNVINVPDNHPLPKKKQARFTFQKLFIYEYDNKQQDDQGGVVGRDAKIAKTSWTEPSWRKNHGQVHKAVSF